MKYITTMVAFMVSIKKQKKEVFNLKDKYNQNVVNFPCQSEGAVVYSRHECTNYKEST